MEVGLRDSPAWCTSRAMCRRLEELIQAGVDSYRDIHMYTYKLEEYNERRSKSVKGVSNIAANRSSGFGEVSRVFMEKQVRFLRKRSITEL